jgi:hypothetical protein
MWSKYVKYGKPYRKSFNFVYDKYWYVIVYNKYKYYIEMLLIHLNVAYKQCL